MKRHELSEAKWERIKDLIPPEKEPHGGCPGKSNREMLNYSVLADICMAQALLEHLI